jgi:hypothetical protein
MGLCIGTEGHAFFFTEETYSEEPQNMEVLGVTNSGTRHSN